MKTLLTLTAIATMAWSSFGQGTVDFNNRNLMQVYPGTDYLVRNPCLFGSPLVGTNYVAQLYYGATVDSLTAVGAPAPFRFETTTFPGTWSGGTRQIPLLDAIGKSVVLEVRVWDSSVAADWDAAWWSLSGLLGKSAPFSFTYIQSTPPATTDDDMVNFRGFTLWGCPEPNTLGLLSLGALGLFFFRRK